METTNTSTTSDGLVFSIPFPITTTGTNTVLTHSHSSPDDPEGPFTVPLAPLQMPESFILTYDGDPIGSTGVETFDLIDSDLNGQLETHESDWGYTPAPMDIDDVSSLEELDKAIRNLRRLEGLYAKMDAAGQLEEAYGNPLVDVRSQLERAPERRVEMIEEEREEKEFEKEAEAEEARRNVCTGSPMGSGILHNTNTTCPKHGSF